LRRAQPFSLYQRSLKIYEDKLGKDHPEATRIRKRLKELLAEKAR
jgi:hypothetical protein